MINTLKKYFIFAFFSSVLIAIDQITKFFAYKNLYGKESIKIIDNILEFTYVENRGAAFGILQNKQTFFYILTVLVFVIIFSLLYKITNLKNDILYFAFLILIFAGACGNFIDRIRNKYVIDFIYFKPIDFPVFNFADICITIGCFLMIIFIVKSKD